LWPLVQPGRWAEWAGAHRLMGCWHHAVAASTDLTPVLVLWRRGYPFAPDWPQEIRALFQHRLD
jgi:hypothetical protein